MIYCEIQLDGRVRFYEATDNRLMLRVSLETEAASLPAPPTIHDAHDFIRSNCHQLEIFDTFAHAENWAENYHNFRAGEVRAELRRFALRRAAGQSVSRFRPSDLYLETTEQDNDRSAVA
jgi:hypothetical protein